MNFKDTIPWDIIDQPVPDSFFGEDVIRVNLIRNGIKNGIITQSRVLAELKELDPESFITQGSKYPAQVKKKIQWLENYYFPKCMKEIQWFEAKWGDDVRRTIAAANEVLKNTPVNVMADKMGYYPKGVAEL